MTAGASSAVDRFADLAKGGKALLGEALTIVEAGGDDAHALLARLHLEGGKAQVVGVTGPPGSGKSTLVNELALHWAARGRRVAIVAVDPTSPFTGGAVLGDRVRMNRASRHENVFIRSAATRGQLGGIARATYDFVRVFDAAGYDPVIVETVGIGQSEIDICRVAHTAVVVESPGLGDAVQAMKAGVLEIASIFCINKADLAGTDAKALQLAELADRAAHRNPDWRIPIVQTVASEVRGIAELADKIEAHRAYLASTDRLVTLERDRALAEIRASLEALVVDGPLRQARGDGRLAALAEDVASRRLSSAEAARAIERDYVRNGEGST
ncbi:MAG: methylmalonyl Co-A mutase-associated GTPase MeaB [Burkholderiales bacterium]